MDTRVFLLAPGEARPEGLAAVAAALAAGAVVGVAKETFYGLVARKDAPEAVARLRAAAGLPEGRPLSVYAWSAKAALAAVPGVPPRALPLVRRFWPGPVTLVVGAGPEGSDRSEQGVRVPAHPAMQALLEALPAGVVAVGASAEGAPLSSGAAALERWKGAIDWLVDAGETTLREPSTVVRVRPDGWECLRDGIVSRDMLARHLTTTVLFVCTGNSCRSPMAEALFRRRLSQRLSTDDETLEKCGFRVLSAGTGAFDGGRAAAMAVQIMAERAIDLSRHKTRALTADLLDEATAVFVMSQQHLYSIEDWWPEFRGKVHLLDEEGIEDPIGGSAELYRRTAEMIERSLDRAIDLVLPLALLPEKTS